ncbi:MAG: hypothetical protein AAF738_01250 [Bacteroidota bacterium]
MLTTVNHFSCEGSEETEDVTFIVSASGDNAVIFGYEDEDGTIDLVAEDALEITGCEFVDNISEDTGFGSNLDVKVTATLEDDEITFIQEINLFGDLLVCTTKATRQ